MAASSVLTGESHLTPEQRAEYEAQARQEWEARFVERIRYALLLEPELAKRIVLALALAMEADDRLASRVRKALPRRGANGRPASRAARKARISYETSLSLYEAYSPGARGNKARSLRDAASASGLEVKSVDRLISPPNAKVGRKSNTRK